MSHSKKKYVRGTHIGSPAQLLNKRFSWIEKALRQKERVGRITAHTVRSLLF